MASRSSSAKAGGALDPALPQKKRARRRLVGALAVCVAAAIVLPLVLDSEPRQVRPDVQVQIPSRDTPLNERLPGTSRSGVIDSSRPVDAVADTASDRAGAGAVAGNVAGTGAAVQGGSSASGAMAAGKPETSKADAAGTAPADTTSAGPQMPNAHEAKPVLGRPGDENRLPDAASSAAGSKSAAAGSSDAKSSDGRPAIGKSADGKTSDAKAADTKAVDAKATDAKVSDAKVSDAKAKDGKPGYLLQAGAFSAAKGANEQVERVRSAGLKAYTEKVQTANGERIRVRLGPYPDRQAAERARDKLRAAGLESTLIAP
jgi:DedD protein